jgi:hypothetical protein
MATSLFPICFLPGFPAASAVPRRLQRRRRDVFGGFDPVAVATSQNFRRDARLGMASGYQDFRVIRLQAKFSF